MAGLAAAGFAALGAAAARAWACGLEALACACGLGLETRACGLGDELWLDFTFCCDVTWRLADGFCRVAFVLAGFFTELVERTAFSVRALGALTVLVRACAALVVARVWAAFVGASPAFAGEPVFGTVAGRPFAAWLA